MLYTCRELHLVKPKKTWKRQITSLRDAPDWETGPDSPFAHSRESHLRWEAVLHSKAGKQQGKPGLFQPQGGFYFSFKHLWCSQVKLHSHAGSGGWHGTVIWKGQWSTQTLMGTQPLAVQGYKIGHSSGWRRGIPREKGDYFTFNRSFSCRVLISLLIPPFRGPHVCLRPPVLHLSTLPPGSPQPLPTLFSAFLKQLPASLALPKP